MRNGILIVSALTIFIALNIAIWRNEQIINTGKEIYLELAPVDPRSIMQGDYMRLGYQITNTLPKELVKSAPKHGQIIFRPNKDNLAQFIRVNDGEPLATDEYPLKFHKQYNRLRLVPDSFFFQEGLREQYEQAKYAVFKFSGSKKGLLVDLADEHKTVIRPK